MKLGFIKTALVMGLLSSTSVFATTGTITFTGMVLNSTCAVSVNSTTPDGTVVLQPVLNNAFASLTDGEAISTNAQNFTLTLDSNCPSSGVVPYFVNNAANVHTNGTLKNRTNAGDAEYVAIALYADAAGTEQNKINITEDLTQVKSTGVNNVFPYTAKYAKNGSTSDITTAGLVNASVTYALTYP
ncbi:type 1 fimbrial protein [Acinetobacter sp. 187]|uniref:fimbrial protein n=1 Tax=Acinetobacter lanii TaxID=2715163 RepID=UPI0014090651|nr:fimbrial protein [Acinetobacter lanii]NHC03430.1 type 1 fimbrial protein [Acinetobacter lanii]